MIEPELPVVLTFENTELAHIFVGALESAREQVIWEQRVDEDGRVIVTIMNIINLEEKADKEEK